MNILNPNYMFSYVFGSPPWDVLGGNQTDISHMCDKDSKLINEHDIHI